jgi:hypothetical protein
LRTKHYHTNFADLSDGIHEVLVLGIDQPGSDVIACLVGICPIIEGDRMKRNRS